MQRLLQRIKHDQVPRFWVQTYVPSDHTAVFRMCVHSVFDEHFRGVYANSWGLYQPTIVRLSVYSLLWSLFTEFWPRIYVFCAYELFVLLLIYYFIFNGFVR